MLLFLHVSHSHTHTHTLFSLSSLSRLSLVSLSSLSSLSLSGGATLDGSNQGSLTLSAADATGGKICFKDVGNGFGFVDTGLRLPVVQLTAISPGTSNTAAKVGVGIATTVTLTATGATTSDRIKFVAAGSACSAGAVSGGGAYTLLTSGSTASVTLGATTANAKICYDPSSSGFFTDTTLTLTAVS